MSHAVAVFLGGFDVSQFVPADTGVVIRHGRPNSTEQPSPSSTVVEFDAIPRPDLIAVGVTLWVNVWTPAAMEWQRAFTGRVSDVEARLAANGRTRHNIIATSDGLGRMANRRIGDVPWPVELDGARIEKILAAAGVDVGTVDPGTVRFVNRDVDSQDSLQLAQSYAAQAFGVLVDERNGSVSYRDANARDPEQPPAAVITAGEILNELGASQRTATVVNRIAIRYGPDPQAELREQDSESIALWGRRDQSMTTELASVTDAEHVARTLLRLYSEPRWGSEVVVIPVSDIARRDPARADLLATLPTNIMVVINGSPEPLPDNYAVWVEGVEDRITGFAWERSLLVSDRYMAPVVEPPPIEPGDCATFDWPRLCTTDNVFPGKSGPALQLDALWTPAGSESVEWETAADGSDTMLYRVEAGATASAIYGIGPLTTIAIGSPGQTHPDPWQGAGDAPDFCIRFDGFQYTEIGRPENEPNAEWKPISGGSWAPAYYTFLPMNFWRWEPDDGWAPDEAEWADGAPPPTVEGESSLGCNVWEYGRYEYENPGLTRKPTRPGRWQAMYFGMASGAEGEEMPPMFTVRLKYAVELRIKHYRWARAFA